MLSGDSTEKNGIIFIQSLDKYFLCLSLPSTVLYIYLNGTFLFFVMFYSHTIWFRLYI